MKVLSKSVICFEPTQDCFTTLLSLTKAAGSGNNYDTLACSILYLNKFHFMSMQFVCVRKRLSRDRMVVSDNTNQAEFIHCA